MVLSEYNKWSVGNHICGKDPNPQCVSQMPGHPQELGKNEEGGWDKIDSKFSTGCPEDKGEEDRRANVWPIKRFQHSCQLWSSLFMSPGTRNGEEIITRRQASTASSAEVIQWQTDWVLFWQVWVDLGPEEWHHSLWGTGHSTANTCASLHLTQSLTYSQLFCHSDLRQDWSSTNLGQGESHASRSWMYCSWGPDSGTSKKTFESLSQNACKRTQSARTWATMLPSTHARWQFSRT